MKKSKILGALALASCVMLSGCNRKPEEPSADPAIAVADLPASVNLGAGLNLDQYVTLTSLSEYSIELASASQDSASVSGHVVTPLVEGEIKFTVKSGTLSKECTITAVSQDRSKIEAYFEDIGNEYLVAEYQYDEEEGDWAPSGAVIHTKQYVFNASMGAGFLRYAEDDTDTFYFELSYDESGTYTGVDEDSLELMSASYFDLYYNPELEIDFEETVAIYDVENSCEAIVISGLDATFFAEEALFIPNGELYFEEGDDAPGYPVERVELVLEEGVYEGEPYSLVTAYPYVEYEGEWELFAACEFYVGEDAESFPLLDEYCVPANKPEAIDYWSYFDGYTLDKLFPSDGFEFGSCGSISLTYGWYNASMQPIATPESTSETYFSYLYAGSLDKVFNETSIWAVDYTRDPETGDITAITPTSGKMQKTVSEVTSVYDVYATPDGDDPFYVEADADNASVWADSVPTLGALREHTSWAPGSIISATEPTEQKSYYSLAFGPGKTHDVLFGIINFDEEGAIYNLGLVINIYAQGGLDVESMFQGGLYVDPVAKEVTIQYIFGWSANEIYMVNLEIKADDSLAETIAGFETAATPYLPTAA
jgi:hypothetical protein